MPTIVKVQKWGNSLVVPFPISFAAEHSIFEGTMVDIDQLKILISRPRRSRYKLKGLLKNYVKPPKDLDFPRVGKELS